MLSRLPYVWAVMASLLWGLGYALDERILKTVSFLHLLAFNAVITLLCVVPILIARGDFTGFLSMPSRDLRLLLLSSFLAVLANACIFLGIKNLGASAASIIEISYPFFVVLFCILLWGERPSPSFFIGAFFLFLGSWIVARGRM